SRCWQLERARNLHERCLLGFAYGNASNAQKTAFLRRFGNVLTDLAQPTFECSGIAGRLGVDDHCCLSQYLDALALNLGGFAALELILQAIAGDSTPFGRPKIVYDGFDESVS